jgi:DNA-binding Lrp family transcriptional regulator
MMTGIEGHVADKVVRALGELPEVSAIHTTNGRWDLIVELGTTTLADLDALLRRVRLIPGVANSETSLMLATARSAGQRCRIFRSPSIQTETKSGNA